MAGPPVVNDRIGGPVPVAKAAVVAPKNAPKPNAVSQAVNRLGIPLTDQQIQQQAQSYLNPLVQSLLANTQAQSQQGNAAIQGYTQSLVNSLKPFAAQAGQIYSGAEQSQAASDAALSQRLSGGGSDQAAQLASRLGSINAPGAVNEAVQGATNTGVGTGNALYGTGSASLANLIASGAAAQNYAGKLPGLAGEQGLQQAGQFQTAVANQQGKALSDIQSQIPGLVQSLQGQNQTLRSNRESFRQSILQNQAANAYKKQALAQSAAALKISQGYKGISANQAQQRIAISQQNANISAQRAAASEAVAQANYGLSVKRLQLAQQKASTARKVGGLSASALAGIQLKAAKDAEDLYHGTTRPNSKDPAHPIVLSYSETYQDAFKTLLRRYPALGPKGATKLLNTWYQPGQFGRPAMTKKQQKVADSLFASPFFGKP